MKRNEMHKVKALGRTKPDAVRLDKTPTWLAGCCMEGRQLGLCRRQNKGPAMSCLGQEWTQTAAKGAKRLGLATVVTAQFAWQRMSGDANLLGTAGLRAVGSSRKQD